MNDTYWCSIKTITCIIEELNESSACCLCSGSCCDLCKHTYWSCVSAVSDTTGVKYPVSFFLLVCLERSIDHTESWGLEGASSLSVCFINRQAPPLPRAPLVMAGMWFPVSGLRVWAFCSHMTHWHHNITAGEQSKQACLPSHVDVARTVWACAACEMHH